jgi:hypothetical protein
MAVYLNDFAVCLRLGERGRCQFQQCGRQFLQRRLFIRIDVAARVLGKAINKYPAAASVGRNQRAVASPFSFPRSRNPLFQQVPAGMAIYKTRWFARWARKEGLSDKALWGAVGRDGPRAL